MPPAAKPPLRGSSGRRRAPESPIESPDPYLQALGELVLLERHRRRWTQGELAARAGVGRFSVTRIEAGHGCALAAALRVIAVLDLGPLARTVGVPTPAAEIRPAAKRGQKKTRR